MPVWNVLVRNARCHVKHDDTALSVDIVSIAETTKLFLACSVPHIKLNGTEVLCSALVYLVSGLPHEALVRCAYCCEAKRVDLYTEGCNVLLFELASKMALDKGGLDENLVSFQFHRSCRANRS